MTRGCLLLVLCARAAAAQPADPLACPTASGDERTRKARAAERFRHGQELYADGEYERSIPEFLAAYCLAPVPEAIYNMAQAYERLVDYQRAVTLFEAYIKALPPSSKEEIATVQHRVKALRRLPARIRVATDPPGAHLRLDGPGGKIEGQANAEPLRVPAGRYTMHVDLAGYLPVVDEIVAEIGQPYTYSYRLSPQTGTLRVVTRPGEARILVDDRVVGAGSYIDRLPVGTHRVSVEAEDRPTEKRLVIVDPDSDVRLAVVMKPAQPPNGKLELLIDSAAFGVVEGGLFGTAITDEKPAIVGLAAAVGAAGFVIPYFALPGELPVGQSSLMTGFRLWGGLEGLTIAMTLFPGQAFDEHDHDTILIAVAGSISLGVGAGFLARRIDLSAGDAAVINSGAAWGTGLGILSFLSFFNTTGDAQAAGPLTLVGLNAGLLTGALLANQTELSRGHLFLIDVAGFAGMVSATALSAILGEDDLRSRARFALGGMVAGLAVGTFVTRDLDVDTSLLPVAGAVTDRAGTTVPTFGLVTRW